MKRFLAPVLLLAVLVACVTCAQRLRTDPDTSVIPGPQLGESTAAGPENSSAPLPDATGPVELSSGFLGGRSGTVAPAEGNGGAVAPEPPSAGGGPNGAPAPPPAAPVGVPGPENLPVPSAIPPSAVPIDAGVPLPNLPGDAGPSGIPPVPPDAAPPPPAAPPPTDAGPR